MGEGARPTANLIAQMNEQIVEMRLIVAPITLLVARCILGQILNKTESIPLKLYELYAPSVDDD